MNEKLWTPVMTDEEKMTRKEKLESRYRDKLSRICANLIIAVAMFLAGICLVTIAVYGPTFLTVACLIVSPILAIGMTVWLAFTRDDPFTESDY